MKNATLPLVGALILIATAVTWLFTRDGTGNQPIPQVAERIPDIPEPEAISLRAILEKHHLQNLTHCFAPGDQIATVISEDVYAGTIKTTRIVDGFEARSVDFFGTPDDLRRLGAELDFIRNASEENGLEESLRLGKQVGEGFKDTVVELVMFVVEVGQGTGNILNPAQLWSEAARQKRRDVTEKLDELGESVGTLIELARECGFDQEKIENVVVAAFDSYWSNSRETVANDYGFSQAHIWFADPTYPLLDTATKARVGGRLLPEVLLIAIPMSKVAHAKKITQADKMLDTAGAVRVGRLRHFDNLHAKSARISQTNAARGFAEHCKKFESLVDPAKLQTLKVGNRAANPRFRILLSHIYDLQKKTGKSYKEILDAVYNDLPKSGKVSGRHIYAPLTEKKNLLSQLKLGERYGLNSAENIERTRKGSAPIISKGKHAGKVAHVDHIIPLKSSPELENSMANLRWLPSDQNLKKGASMSNAALRRMDELETEVGWKPASRRPL